MSLPKRILWFTWKDSSHPLAGGAETVNEEIAKRLAARGCQITFLVGGFRGGDALVERDGYRVERVGNRFTCYFQAWRKYRREYRGWADLVIDEINTMPFFAGWYVRRKKISPPPPFLSASEGSRSSKKRDGVLRPAATVLSNGKIPVLLFVHQLCREIWFYQLPWVVAWIGYLLEPLYLRLLSHLPVVTVSQSTKCDLLRYGFRAERIALISEGITLEPVDDLGTNTPPPSLRLGILHKEENHTLASETNGGSGIIPSLRKVADERSEADGRCSKSPRPTVLILGAIREMKRTDHAVRAYELARDIIPDLQLIVAGPVAREPRSFGKRRGERRAGRKWLSYGEKVLDLIATSRHASDITYAGRVDEVRKVELMRTSHVLLSCAVKEGWGLTVTEANSQGTPAVVYDADGLRDSVRHDETGIVCPPTPQAMADAIIALLSDGERYERLRRNAWEWSRTLTFDRATEDFVEAVTSLVGSHEELNL